MIKKYIKKHGVPEQYPIMMLVGFKRFDWSWPWQMAEGHLGKWFWHKWEFWEVFSDHDVQVHYKCWRFLGFECWETFQVQPSSDFPHPFACFTYSNNGHATFGNSKSIMTIGYPTGEYYPKGTVVEQQVKYAFLDEAKMISGEGFKKETEDE